MYPHKLNMFSQLNCLFCVYILIILETASAWNVYEGNYRQCQYKVSKKVRFFQNYTRTIRYGEHEVHFNLCNNITGISGCDNDGMVCVKKSGSAYVSNAGRNFTVENGQFVALNGSTCTGSKKYKTILRFENFQEENEKFHLDDCALTISINPEPSCSTDVNGFMLDVSPLSLLNNITVNSSAGLYSVAICNYSSACGEPNSGCLQNSTGFIDYRTQKLEYNYSVNKLIVKGSDGKKNVRQFSFNCNWFVTLGKTEKLVRKYEFGIDTKYGCVKLPMNCKLEKMDKYLYDLSKLNRPAGWHLQLPEGNGMITLNVCGPLEQPSKNKCSEIHSQVCLKQKEGYIGLGSIGKPLEAINEGTGLELELHYGSLCPKDNSEFLNSKIKFVCGETETGPKFISFVNCTYNFLWKTPEACPKLIGADKEDFTQENSQQEVLDCKIGEFFNLNPLVLNTSNYEVKDDDGNIYYINLCRPLVITKETYGCLSKSACFSNASDVNLETKYIGFGGTNLPKLVDDDLVLNYNGGSCKGFTPYELEIKFRCAKELKNSITLSKRSECKIEFFWDTSLVCKESLVKCHNIFNFDKITASQMLVNTGPFHYNFNLCDSRYTVKTLRTGDEIIHNARTTLKYLKCQYMLEYRLANDRRCDDPRKLHTVYLTFECTKKATDYYEKESVSDCVLHMKFWTSQACNISKNASDEDCTPKKAPEKSNIFQYSTSENVEKVERSERAHRNCSISLTGGESINISSIAPFQVISQSKNVYTIANTTSVCGDFICKNSASVGSIVDVCPSMNIDLLKRQVRMDFIGSTCGRDFFKTALLYRCNKSETDLPNVLSEFPCNSTIEVPNVLICKMLQPDLHDEASSGTHGGLIAGIVIMVIIITAIIGILIWHYLRRKNYMAVDKSQLYLRNCRD